MKKILTRSGIALVTVAVVVAGAAAFSAYEAHIVNVTATIDNATDISTSQLLFGQVFPQEVLHQPVTLSLSQSFTKSGAVGVDYVIKQKPKCVATNPTDGQPQYAQASENSDHIFICPQGYQLMPLLCPFLSKTSPTTGDVSVPSFHGPITTPAWTDTVSAQYAAVGHLTKKNPSTTWDIDLHVPCFKGECAQDWASYVHTANAQANPADYMLNPNLKGQALGCDLWYELTSVDRTARSEVVYNSVPSPLAGNYPSQPFQAQQASEFGGQVLLTGTNRNDPKITVMMSSWGCESGNWNLGTCSTTPGATFTHPITLNIYNVGAGNSVGSLIATKTDTFAIPYRPSADNTNCTGGNAGKWWDGTACNNGLATPISFNLNGVTLPNKVIVSLAYNTTSYGYTPMGATACSATTQGCGYDSLNVALNTLGSVTYPLPDGAYFNSVTAGAYGDGGAGGTGFFRLDPIGWTAYQPIIKIEAQ